MWRRALASLACCLTACGLDSWPEPRGRAATCLHGTAPLSAGAVLVVRAFPAGDVVGQSRVAADGSYAVALADAGGDLLLEARGGNYREAAGDQAAVQVGDEVLRALALQVVPFSQQQTAITPFSHLVAEAARRDGLAAARRLQDALVASLTCCRPQWRHLLRGDAATLPLARLYLGGFSELAARQGCSSVALVQRLEDPAAPHSLLRQPLAQATRHVALHQGPLPPGDWEGLLDCLASDLAAAPGGAGKPLDREAPQVELWPARPGNRITTRRRFTCRACDVSALESLTVEVVDAAGCRQATPTLQRRSEPPCTLVEGLLEPAGLTSGAVRCRARDIWGHEAFAHWAIVVP